MQLRIKSHQVHLWHLYVPDGSDFAYDERMAALLTPQERETRTRFHLAQDRRRYLMTRWLLRSVLSCYAPISPQDWCFEKNAYGRPHIANMLLRSRQLRFNISHSSSLVVIALALAREVGVDVEHTAETAPFEVASRFFSTKEYRALQQLPADLRSTRFWDLWTLKESYVKARGMGLSLPLNKFSFSFDNADSISVDFDKDLRDSAARWQFWQLQPDSTHSVALCLERSDRKYVQFHCWKATPPFELAGEFHPKVIRRSLVH